MKQKELEVIKQAIINEIEGYEFYKMAAKQSTSKEGEEAFIELAEEELKHAEYLQELFKKVQNEDDDTFNLALLGNPPSPKIFDWDNVSMKSSDLAVSVFGIAMDMEKTSVKFYEAAKKETTLEEAKKLYDMLVKWENIHWEQFAEQYNKHKEVWWADQGFSPF